MTGFPGLDLYPISEGENGVPQRMLQENFRRIREWVAILRGTALQPPTMTTAERDAITDPSGGRTVYNSDTGRLNYFDATTATWRVA